jgi:hypothetical protein
MYYLVNSVFQKSWVNLANHKSANVRYRVACHLNDIPEPIKSKVLSSLIKDKSKKVKSMVEARIEEYS